MKTKRQKPKTKPKGDEFPLKVSRGNAIVKIYRTVSAKGYTSYQVPNWDTGKRRLLTFSKLAEAEAEAKGIGDKLNTGEGLALNNADAATYQSAVALLPPGVNLLVAVSAFAESFKVLGGALVIEAARFYAKKNLAALEVRSVPQVVDELLKAREGKAVSTFKDYKYRLGTFAEEFSCPITNVTGSEIQSFLNDLELSPQSCANFGRVIKMMFRFAVLKGYLSKDWDEMDRIEKVDIKDSEEPPEIYTPEEMARLLVAASPEFLPCLAIAGFAGLRSSEVERLDWSQVRLAEKFIEVRARKGARGRKRRLVPITDNLAAWLAPHAKKCGSVWAGLHDEYYEAQQETAVATKTEEEDALKWKRNGLRHSFISYRLAELQNENQVAMEAGNSPGMIHGHYKELVRPDDAKRWFAISPAVPVNMVSIKQAPAEKIA